MDTYWHRLCQNLPPSLASEGRQLLKSTGLRPPVGRYLRLWQLIKPLGHLAEGLALLTEGTRLWPRAISLKLELARLYLDQGDGRRVTKLLSVADAQKDPACGLVVLKAALLSGKVEWVRALAPSLAIAKLDKSEAERDCLALCHKEYWQDAADLIRRHYGLPPAPAPARGEPPPAAQPTRMPATDDFRAFAGYRSADITSLRRWLTAPDDQPWQDGEDQLTSSAQHEPSHEARAVLVKSLLAAARNSKPSEPILN